MKTAGKFAALGALLAAASFLSLSLGTEPLSPLRLLEALAGNGPRIDSDIVLYIRLPRLALGLIIGASLAASGAVLQSLLRNPLADPYIIGVSGGAALGASAAIILSLGFFFTAGAAFAGSLLAVAAVYAISRRIGIGSTPLILSGISLSFILSSSVLLLYALASAERVHRSLLWMMGDLSLARYDVLAASGAACVALVGLAWLLHRSLDVISFGSGFSLTHGVTKGAVGSLFWIAALLAALSVSLAGVIGFVGLIVPHAARRLFGPSHRSLVPASALSGGLLLVLADSFARSVAPPYEIPVGVITAFIGGVFFLVLMLRGGEG